MNLFRTQLVVQAILEVEPVPSSVPPGGLISKSGAMFTEKYGSSVPPLVTQAALPIYPYQAWYTGIDGRVVVDVRVEAGNVVEATVRTGERMLRDAALENIRSWRFKPDVTRTFTTTFVYQLELRPTAESQHPRIIMELPGRVTIIGAENGW